MYVPQAQLPSGWLGRPFGWIMERMNQSAYHTTLDLLAPSMGGSYLEIGTGTGAFLELVARNATPDRLVGFDPSELMVRRTRHRLDEFSEISVEIQIGTDEDLSSVVGPIRYVAAIHSYQFWRKPKATLQNIYNLMEQGGTLCLALRHHKIPAPEWLPNSISRSKDEVGLTLDLLRSSGFDVVQQPVELRHTTLLCAARL